MVEPLCSNFKSDYSKFFRCPNFLDFYGNLLFQTRSPEVEWLGLQRLQVYCEQRQPSRIYRWKVWYTLLWNLLLSQSSQKLLRLYKTFGLVIFQVLPDQQLLYQTEYIVTRDWLSKIWQLHEKRIKNEWLNCFDKWFEVLYEFLHKVWMLW